ncbi:MAG: SDR family NAD(P)-dependent oxidoreductase [Rubrivivax sp.]
MRLKDQSAIVTGAASGFGAAIAERFSAEGARVVVADLNEAQGQAVAQRIGGVFARCDVSRAGDVQARVQTAVRAPGRLDIVVNNAGVTHVNKPHLDVTEDEFDRLYRINVKSLFHMNRAAVPAMRANPGGSSGVFINVASTTGVRPGPGLCWYSGSKGAVITTSKGLALELARALGRKALGNRRPEAGSRARDDGGLVFQPHEETPAAAAGMMGTTLGEAGAATALPCASASSRLRTRCRAMFSAWS